MSVYVEEWETIEGTEFDTNLLAKFGKARVWNHFCLTLLYFQNKTI